MPFISVAAALTAAAYGAECVPMCSRASSTSPRRANDSSATAPTTATSGPNTISSWRLNVSAAAVLCSTGRSLRRIYFRTDRRNRRKLDSAVGHDAHLAVLLPQPLEHGRGHAGHVRVTAAPAVEHIDVIEAVVAEHRQDVVDAARPAVGGDALAEHRRSGPVDVLDAVPDLAQDVERGADGGPVVVLAGPLVDLLGLVVEPETVVGLAVELRHHPRGAEADAGTLLALVVEVPPGVGVERAARLQAHAVPAADLAQLGVARDPVVALRVLLRLVELDVPVDPDHDRGGLLRRRRGRERESFDVLPVARWATSEGSGHLPTLCGSSLADPWLGQSLYGSNVSAPAIATPSGVSRCMTSIVSPCAASTASRRLYAPGASSAAPSRNSTPLPASSACTSP